MFNSNRIMKAMLVVSCIALQSTMVDGFTVSRSMRRSLQLPRTTTAIIPSSECLLTRDILQLASTQSSDDLEESAFSPRRISYLTLWAGLLAYTTYFTSTVTPEAALVAPAIMNTAIFTPFDGTLSPVFVTLFFFLGILPCVFGSLLLPASKKQKVWALPFVASSFALGFFGIGPYLGLRNRAPSPEILMTSDRDTGAAAFDNKITPIFLFLSTVYLVYFAFTGSYEGTDRWQGYLDLFNSQPLARISTIDFTILSLAVRTSLSI